MRPTDRSPRTHSWALKDFGGWSVIGSVWGRASSPTGWVCSLLGNSQHSVSRQLLRNLGNVTQVLGNLELELPSTGDPLGPAAVQRCAGAPNPDECVPTEGYPDASSSLSKMKQKITEGREEGRKDL